MVILGIDKSDGLCYNQIGNQKRKEVNEVPNPNDKLVKALRDMGLSDAVIDRFVRQASDAAERQRLAAERQAKIDNAKQRIIDVLAPVVTELGIDFTITVRGGKVDVKASGASGGGGVKSPPTQTPIKDTGHQARTLVKYLLPDELEAFTSGDKNKRHHLGIKAAKVYWQTYDKPGMLPEP